MSGKGGTPLLAKICTPKIANFHQAFSTLGNYTPLWDFGPCPSVCVHNGAYLGLHSCRHWSRHEPTVPIWEVVRIHNLSCCDYISHLLDGCMCTALLQRETKYYFEMVYGPVSNPHCHSLGIFDVFKFPHSNATHLGAAYVTCSAISTMCLLDACICVMCYFPRVQTLFVAVLQSSSANSISGGALW